MILPGDHFTAVLCMPVFDYGFDCSRSLREEEAPPKII